LSRKKPRRGCMTVVAWFGVPPSGGRESLPAQPAPFHTDAGLSGLCGLFDPPKGGTPNAAGVSQERTCTLPRYFPARRDLVQSCRNSIYLRPLPVAFFIGIVAGCLGLGREERGRARGDRLSGRKKRANVQRGDQPLSKAAWRKLYAEFYLQTRAWLVARVRNEPDADDLEEEVFARLARAGPAEPAPDHERAAGGRVGLEWVA
jgi:hypothetical protein